MGRRRADKGSFSTCFIAWIVTLVNSLFILLADEAREEDRCLLYSLRHFAYAPISG